MADLRVFRELLKKQKRAEQDVWNVAKSTFQPGVKVQYVDREREHFGEVIEMIGVPSAPQLRVKNLATMKQRDISLTAITGLVQEH